MPQLPTMEEAPFFGGFALLLLMGVALEIIALRHQITVLQRTTPKPKLKPLDRRIWVWLSGCWTQWLLPQIPPSLVLR